MFERIRLGLIAVLGVVLCLFTLVEVNFPMIQIESRRAIFVLLGMAICLLHFPLHKRFENVRWLRYFDLILVVGVVVCCGYIVVQSEDVFEQFWYNSQSLGNRAGAETTTDMVIGLIGLVLVLEVTRRAIGWIVPILASLFILHSLYCYYSIELDLVQLPEFLFPQSGLGPKQLASKTFLTDVFGIPVGVMFKYVFLFVIFGAFLEISGATQFIINFAQRVCSRFTGGPALVSVVGSGMMGSLSGSAVANAMMTGSFTVPMMKSDGFEGHTAGGISAAAATGGALVPPVMGAGAYMMLDLVDPTLDSFLQVARAAVVPACLYYFSLLAIVFLYSKRKGSEGHVSQVEKPPINFYDGFVFFAALFVLVSILVLKFTAFKAVTAALVVILILTCFRKKLGKETEVSMTSRIVMLAAFVVGSLGYLGYVYTQTDYFEIELTGKRAFECFLDCSFIGMYAMVLVGLFERSWKKTIVTALVRSSKNGVALVAASACVGIIIGLVGQGLSADFSAAIKGVVAQSLLLALIGIMFCSIVLGMGVPSVVCYLLVATLMASVLGELGVIPLAAHLFIFYFGMMSMVTPPVALAAYASAAIAKAKIMRTAMAAFKFSLVGFTLPFMFVYRPALLLMNQGAWDAWMAAPDATNEKKELLEVANYAFPSIPELAIALTSAIFGIIALAAAIAGFLRAPLHWSIRLVLLIAAGMLLIPEIQVGESDIGVWVNLGGGLLFLAVLFAGKYLPTAPVRPAKPRPQPDPDDDIDAELA